MAFKPITTPSTTTIQGKGGKVSLVWNAGAAGSINSDLEKRQRIIDSEVLKLCAPMVPHRSGTLERSGITGTVIGSGEVKYTAPYSRRQYFKTATSRSYDPRRGGMWFERMKTAHKDHILRLISK